jgi:hypothetical protein
VLITKNGFIFVATVTDESVDPTAAGLLDIQTFCLSTGTQELQTEVKYSISDSRVSVSLAPGLL